MPSYHPSSTAEDPAEEFFQCVGALSDADSQQLLLPGLRRRLEAPPVALINGCLQRLVQELSEEQVRRLLFYPTPDDMRLYPALLAGDSSCPDDLTGSPANKAQAIALAHLWLVHGRCWERMRPLIEAGGLSTTLRPRRQLAQLVCHSNAMLASQALQLLIQATHPDMYDWNKPPDWTAGSPDAASSTLTAPTNTIPSTQAAATAAGDPSSNLRDDSSINGCSTAAAAAGHQAHPALGHDGPLWQQLAGLQSGPLLAGLLALSPDRFPGSGYQALQLLAFYLTWLRTWWCRDGVLQLSQPLLSGLAKWSVRSSAAPEERQLAAQLLRDFAAAGPAPAAAAAAADGSAEAGGVGVTCGSELLELRVVAAKTQVMRGPCSEAERLKAAGNSAFQARDWTTAIQHYSAALDVPVPAAALLGEGPRRASYLTNRAAAYLERVKELQAAAAAAAAAAAGPQQACNNNSSSGWQEVGGALDGLQLDGGQESISRQLQAAVLDCRAALELVPGHAKAHYRLAAALRAQGLLPQALAAARSAEHHAAAAADKAAAARLAAEIQQQQQQVQRVDRHQHSTAGSGDHAAAANRSACHSGGSDSSNPLDQLLQQFDMALAAQAAKQQANGPCEIQLLPHRAESSDNDATGSDICLLPLLPQSKQHGEQQPAKSPLVQVLASSDDAVA